jgi:amidase
VEQPLSERRVATIAAAHGLPLHPKEHAELAAAVNVLLGEAPAFRETTKPSYPEPALIPHRVSAKDPFNAIVRWCSVDARRSEGTLAGTRVAVKDSISLAGLPLTCGSAVLQGFLPTEHSAVARLAVAAGARVVAVTNMDDLAVSGAGDSSWYGPVLNPFDHSRGAGGSSGGSAASVWYEGIDLALGTDQAGSVRIPASWCGVIGVKPTHGLVPYGGVVSLDRSLDHLGVLGRNTREVAALMAVIATRPDFLAAVTDAPRDLRGVRIGLLEEGFTEDVGTEPGTAAAIREVAESLGQLGATLQDVSLPAHRATGAAYTGLAAEGLVASLDRDVANGVQPDAWPELRVALRSGIRTRGHELAPHVKAALLLGWHLRGIAAEQHKASGRHFARSLTRGYDRILERVDLIAMPTTPSPAQPLRALLDPRAPLGRRLLLAFANSVNTRAANLTGHPAISLPTATVGGLPVGLMLVAPARADARLLAVARVYEREVGWEPHPGWSE